MVTLTAVPRFGQPALLMPRKKSNDPLYVLLDQARGNRTWEKFAEDSGIAYSTFNTVLRRKVDPRASTLIQIAMGTGVPFERFMAAYAAGSGIDGVDAITLSDELTIAGDAMQASAIVEEIRRLVQRPDESE